MAETEENAIYKGDNTGAFGNNYITIKVKNPLLMEISKILFIVNGGVIIKEFTDENNFAVEDIELVVNFDSGETAKLNNTNTGNLVAYDTYTTPEGVFAPRQCTCQQFLTFTAKNGVICRNGRSCC